MAIALCQQKYNIQALGIIPAVETPCTLTNPHSQSLDWVGNTGNMININQQKSNGNLHVFASVTNSYNNGTDM